MATLYEVDLPGDRVVVLRELTAGEFEAIYRAEGGKPTMDWELTQRGIRMSLVQDRGEALSYTQLTGSLLTDRFSTREMLLLRQAWERIHLPSQEEVARVREPRATASLGSSS